MTVPNNALAVFSEAHRKGLEKIELLQGVVDDLPRELDLTMVRRRLGPIFEFIEGDLRSHFEQEEEILFPTLEAPLVGPGPIKIDGAEPELCYVLFCEGACREHGPLAVYRSDHGIIWKAVDKLRSAVELINDSHGDAEVRQLLEQAGLEVIWLLGSHIAKEEEVLLPKAAEVLNRRTLDDIARTLAHC